MLFETKTVERYPRNPKSTDVAALRRAPIDDLVDSIWLQNKFSVTRRVYYVHV